MTRRGFAASTVAAAATVTAGTALGGGEAQAATGERAFRARPGDDRKRRPNFLLLVADDLGWADLSSYGSPSIRTPNLDRLGRQGVRFTQAYSGGAVCSPTRLSLYTGRYPGRLKAGLEEPIPAPSVTDVGLPPSHPTLASLLRDQGYATAMYGKWHCGYLPTYGPLKSGWQEFFGNHSGVVDYYSKVTSDGSPDLYEGEKPVTTTGYYPDEVAQHACDYVRRDHDRPWLLNVNFTAPHWPWEAPGDRATSRELTARAKAGDTNALFHADGGTLEVYRAMVEHLDAQVGRVLDALRRSGQEDDTVVLFFSDNGGERWSYQWPLTAEKASLNEGGIRVATSIRWPRRIDRHQVSHVPLVTPDWTATLLEIAGGAADPAYPLDGTSLAGYLLRGEEAPGHDLFWRTRTSRALRRDRWKYLRAPGAGGKVAESLFDLDADPREQANRAAHEPDLLGTLRSRWEALAADQLPYG